MPLAEEITRAAQALLASKFTIALTGAGISVPSGIPHFRAEGGLWTRYDIHEYGTIQSFHRNPRKCWRLFRELADVVQGAAPNAAHKAMARLEELGLLKAVVTQNIDNLHQEGGSRAVIEFHGTTARLACVACGKRHPAEDAEELADDQRIPLCTCGAVLKPDVVLFGEGIPRDALNESSRLASKATAIIVVGTSAEVAPACLLPDMVARNRGVIVEMNLERTGLSAAADYRIVGDIAETLPALVARVEELRRG